MIWRTANKRKRRKLRLTRAAQDPLDVLVDCLVYAGVSQLIDLARVEAYRRWLRATPALQERHRYRAEYVSERATPFYVRITE